MSATPDDAEGALDELELDHIAVAVEDLDRAASAYAALGMAVSGGDEDIAGQDVRVRALALGASVLELMAPLGPDGPVARFLGRRGPGLHHIALRVPDLDAALARLRHDGAQLIDIEPRDGRGGSRIAFVHPSFTGGVLVELVEPAA